MVSYTSLILAAYRLGDDHAAQKFFEDFTQRIIQKISNVYDCVLSEDLPLFCAVALMFSAKILSGLNADQAGTVKRLFDTAKHVPTTGAFLEIHLEEDRKDVK